MTAACAKCATRARLLAQLAGSIQKRADTDKHPLTGLLRLDDDGLIAALGIPAARARDEKRRARDAAQTDRQPRTDAGSVCIHDEQNYPERLHELGLERPHALFYTGPRERFRALTDPDGRQVAIVGTRRPSQTGRHVAAELGAVLAGAGVPVISGMAFGIDAAAHTGACDAAGPVLAVLGSGADEPSPKTNRPLYNRIRAGGTVVSEFPWGQRPFPWTFPARNRIMAALAYMTVVVEAAERSGSLITVSFADGLDRPVGAVPGSPYSPVSAGTNRLLRDTPAALIRGPADVLDEIYGVGAAERLYSQRPEPVDPASAAILEAVTAGMPLEDVRERVGLTPRELRMRLARLEGDGWIRPIGLGGYARATATPTHVPSLGDEE